MVDKDNNRRKKEEKKRKKTGKSLTTKSARRKISFNIIKRYVKNRKAQKQLKIMDYGTTISPSCTETKEKNKQQHIIDGRRCIIFFIFF